MRRQHSQHPSLKIEQLEARELMAADSTTTLSALNATTQSATSASRTSVVLIPTTTAAPRTYDGTGNNLANPDWGSTDEILLRVAGADYSDGVLAPGRRGSPQRARSATRWSLKIRKRPQRTATFGIHLRLGPVHRPRHGPHRAAGDRSRGVQHRGPGGRRLLRSRPAPARKSFASAGRDTTRRPASAPDNPREQINQITAWIDGSMVYGSDQATAVSLRTFVGGKLRTSAGNLPPTDAAGNFVAGDVRANENIELTSMHALFVREHNWWADADRPPESAAQRRGDLPAGPRDRDRRDPGHHVQGVPARAAGQRSDRHLHGLQPDGRSQHRQRVLDRGVPPAQLHQRRRRVLRQRRPRSPRGGGPGRGVQQSGPAPRDRHRFDPQVLGLHTAQEIDTQIVESLRNFLFGQPGQGGFDLASLNIQRGRDHGLADYNTRPRGLRPAPRRRASPTSRPIRRCRRRSQQLYGTVDNIDLWVGGLAEDHVPAIIGRRDDSGDGRRPVRAAPRRRPLLVPEDLLGRAAAAIESTTLADIIRRNSTISNLQDNVFFLNSEIRGTGVRRQERERTAGSDGSRYGGHHDRAAGRRRRSGRPDDHQCPRPLRFLDSSTKRATTRSASSCRIASARRPARPATRSSRAATRQSPASISACGSWRGRARPLPPTSRWPPSIQHLRRSKPSILSRR